MSKMRLFLMREEYNKEQIRKENKTYIPPTDLQFDVLTYDELNESNKQKVKNILEKITSYTLDSLMEKIYRYDTSILDHLVNYTFL